MYVVVEWKGDNFTCTFRPKTIEKLLVQSLVLMYSMYGSIHVFSKAV